MSPLRQRMSRLLFVAWLVGHFVWYGTLLALTIPPMAALRAFDRIALFIDGLHSPRAWVSDAQFEAAILEEVRLRAEALNRAPAPDREQHTAGEDDDLRGLARP